MNSNSIDVNYVSEGSEGHRTDYDRVLMGELQALNIHLHRMEKARNAVDFTRPFFYAMVDSHVFSFIGNAILRSVQGRPTVGLLFRPGECFIRSTLKYRIKRMLFQMASRLPHVSILMLMPFAVFPAFADVTNGWIYDPQLWDLLHFGFGDEVEMPELRELLRAQAGGRRILMALGAQRQEKGFDYFVDLWCSSAEVRDEFLFVAAGTVDPESAESAARFTQQGGLLMNRRISDAELMYLYRCADIIWSCYAPVYNQASGILGRAVQMGVPVTVRKDSYLEKLGEFLRHPTLAVPFDRLDVAAKEILAWNPSVGDAAERMKLLEEMRTYTLSVLAGKLAADRVCGDSAHRSLQHSG